MSDRIMDNEAAWDKLFQQHQILEEVEENGIFYISAKQIKQHTGREPRLMAKFDHTVNLPSIFSENKLAILPVTRGDYAIAHFDAYHSFEPITSGMRDWKSKLSRKSKVST